MANRVIELIIEANQRGGEVLRDHGLDQWVPHFWCQRFQILPQKWYQYIQNDHYFGVNISMFSLKWT